MGNGLIIMNQTQKVLELNGRKITLIGTAHVSKESMEEVETTIKELTPDCVCVELDEKRSESLQNKEKFKELDIVAVLKRKQGFLLLANLILASFQRRMGANVGVQPGEEMLAAINTANEIGKPAVMVDRPIQTTLRRAWAMNSLWGKCKLLAALLTSAFSNEEVSKDEIENLKTGNEMDSMMDELSDYMPVIKKVLIDERNVYMAHKIWGCDGNNIVAVLGAGHLAGIEEALILISKSEEKTNINEISEVPEKGIGSVLLTWAIPVIIVGLIVSGFIYGGTRLGSQMLLSWVLANAIPAGIGAILATAHPVTILVSMLSAPITSLCPFVGVGFVAGIVQALVCKPKVKDVETLQDDVSKFKGWYTNRILRVLLVLILSSLGSTIGTFVGFGDIISKFFG